MRLLLIAVAAVIATTLVISRPPGVNAALANCGFQANPPTTDGNWAYGHSAMDCYDASTDWLDGMLYEKVWGIDYQRDIERNNTNSSGWIHVYTEYYCNGHGTDDWVVKSRGQDLNGDQTNIVSGPWRSLTC